MKKYLTRFKNWLCTKGFHWDYEVLKTENIAPGSFYAYNVYHCKCTNCGTEFIESQDHNEL